MKVLIFELRVAIQDDANTEEIRSTVSNLISEDDHINDNYLLAHKLRYLRGRYIEEFRDPSIDNLSDEELNAWYERADKELE